MMRAMTQLHAEALRLLTIYEEYKDSDDEFMRRKAHLDLDRFLMENRETAILLMVSGLKAELETIKAPPPRKWWRFKKGAKVNASSYNSFN